jgi:SAM-dependent methyltransferase
MSITSAIMEFTHAYRLWQAPFAKDKFAPVLDHNDLRHVRRVLDVGCGPGTNARHFAHSHYTGIDCNPAYIEYAKRRNKGEFVVADATTYQVSSDQRFDFVLVNSFLHHIDDANCRHILSHLGSLLTKDSHVHILDLVLAKEASLARWLTLHDRGDFPRPLDELLDIVNHTLHPVLVEPYNLGIFGLTLWNMVYLKCRTKI